MKLEGPKLSVLMAVYNGEAHIRPAMTSVLRQSYQNWELIIIDDGSTDATYSVLKGFADERIKIFRQDNQGLTKSLQTAAEKSSGAILVRQDADDLSGPDRFQHIVDAYQQNPNAILFYCDVSVADHTGKEVYQRILPPTHGHLLRKLKLAKNPLVHGALAFPMEAYRKAGGYDSSFVTGQDFHLIICLLKHGEACHIPFTDYTLRIHPESISARKWRTQLEGRVRCKQLIQRELKISVPAGAFCKSVLKSFISKATGKFFGARSSYHLAIANMAKAHGNLVVAEEHLRQCLASNRFHFLARLKRFTLNKA